MNGRIERDMPEAQYHADPALSATGAKLLLRSPAKYKWSLTHRRPEKKEFDLGSAVHAKVLGKGYDIVTVDARDWRTKAAQEARDKAYAEGKVPILLKQVAQINGMAESALKHPDARRVFEDGGDAEVSLFADDPDLDVPLRCRFDFLAPNGEGIDLKTTGNEDGAFPDVFARTIKSFSYHLAHAHYLHVAEQVFGVRPAMNFLVVEDKAPYEVGFYELDDDYMEIGERKALKARRRFAECRANDHWPGPPARLYKIRPPLSAIYDDVDEEEGMTAA